MEREKVEFPIKDAWVTLRRPPNIYKVVSELERLQERVERLEKAISQKESK